MMRHALRLWQIATAVWGYLAWRALIAMGVLRARQSPAQRLARTAERLGTTFIKLGQMLSLRRDLLPEDYVQALQALQDHAVRFPTDQARQTIEQGLGRPIDELFSEFDDTPIGAASIAQVHRGRLRDGRAVVVKVRRPDIRAEVERDLRLLRLAMRVTVALVPVLRGYRAVELAEELGENLRKELDFRREAYNVKRFSLAFKESETINIPAVVDELYSDAVLVQELSGGRRVDDPSLRDEGPALAAAFVDAYLQQFFSLGIFHGDPHPGNLFIMPDGRICFHDFGLVGFLDRATRQGLLAFMQAFVTLDADWLTDAYIDLGVVERRLNRIEFRRGLEELLGDYAGRPLREWSLAEAFVRVAALGREHQVTLPRNLLVFARALLLMETTVRSLDPDFDLLHGLSGKAEAVAAGTVREESSAMTLARLKHETAAAAQALPGALGGWLRASRAGGIELPVAHRGLEGLERHIDRGSNRLALAIVTLGLFIGASLLMQHGVGPRWGEIPVLALFGYLLGGWFTLRLVRGINRSGRL
jgi:ubiquinone biosynthesis protein